MLVQIWLMRIRYMRILDYTTEANIARFWEKVSKGDGDECWEWRASLDGRGYGQFSIKTGRNVRAHRFSYTICCGKIPKDLFVLHRCDNRKCVNPAHLFLGDAGDNIRDCFAKGRARPFRGVGEGNGRAVLTAEKVVVMRRRHKSGDATIRQLREETGLSQAAIWNLVNGRSWKHLPME